MKTQINTSEVSAYSKRFASMLCNQFYRQNSNINGKQIVELSENKQINFFAVKIIFLKWQDEMTNLRSPYFDYSHAEVNKTLTSLMNLLSQNISIARPDFEPVLQEAVADTILMYLSPQSFYAKFFENFSDTIHVANQLKPLAKYIKINKTFFDRLLAYLEREANPTITVNRGHELLQTVASENIINENSDDLFSYLSKFIPVSANNFFVIDEDPLAFDTSTIIPEINISQVKAMETKVAEVFETPIPKTVVEEYHATYTKPASYEPVVSSGIVVEEHKPTEVFTFNSQFVNNDTNIVSVNQQFVQETPKEIINETLDTTNTTTNGKVLTLRDFIPVNKKFVFIQGLFGGSSEEFEQAVDMIDHCNDYHKAIMLIKEKYFRRFAWDLEKDEVKEFYEMVSRKF